VAAVAGLHNGVLGGAGRLACGGAAAHYIDDHKGRLCHRRVAQGLLHEREARAGGGCHGAGTAPTGADNRVYGGKLILHLHKDAAGGEHAAGKVFGDLRGGRYGIACHEAAVRRKRASGAGLVALHELYAAVAQFLDSHKQ